MKVMVNNRKAYNIYVEKSIFIDDEDRWIKAGTKITGVVILAEGEQIREWRRLVEHYPLPNGLCSLPKDWSKLRGTAVMTDGEKEYIAEVHWYQGKYAGKIEWKVKRYYQRGDMK